jgi:hypothetical protein
MSGVIQVLLLKVGEGVAPGMSPMRHLAFVRPHRSFNSPCQLAVGGEVVTTNDHVLSCHTTRDGRVSINLGPPNDRAGRPRG